MGEFRYIIKDEIGIHARPAGQLVKLAKGAGCAITITKGDKTVDATKIMSIMSLGVKTGDEVLVEADDEAVLNELERFFENNL